MFVDILTSAGSTIFVLGVLVFIHELGHFVVAKKVGIKVEKFSLGFPPNIFSKKFGQTTYCIGIIPLGGYVKMAGENPDEEATGAPEEFMSKSVGQRAAVLFAGPFMNYVLAILLLFSVYFFFGQAIIDQDNVIVGEVMKEGPAAQAGIVTDSKIIAINGNEVSNFDSLATQIHQIVDADLELTWITGTDTITSMIHTMPEEIPTADGGVDTIGLIGFSPKITGYKTLGFFASVTNSIEKTHFLVWETAKFVKMYISREIKADMIGGPLFIAQQSGKEAKKGASSLFIFMALLSVNLAVLNILPIPILDGGHLAFLLVEKIRGSPLSIKARMIAQQVGLVILLTMIVFVTYNDILRFIKG